MKDDEPSVRDLLTTELHPVDPPEDTPDPPADDDPPGAVAFVYVPVQPPRNPNAVPEAVTFELRSINGEPGLAIYTTQDRLIAELGEHQPYTRIPVLHLLVQLAHQTLPIAVDPTLQPGTERWTEQSITAWRAAQEENRDD